MVRFLLIHHPFTGGGTQRLIRAIGKAKAMELILTGSMLSAAQAERDGLVCRVVPNDKVSYKLIFSRFISIRFIFRTEKLTIKMKINIILFDLFTILMKY